MMKVLLVIIFALSTSHSLSIKEKWLNFKIKFNKIYNDVKEEDLRLTFFKKNLEKIMHQNEKFERGHSTFRYEVNQFTDLTSEEFLRMFKLLKTNGKRLSTISTRKNLPTGDLPDKIDWRTRGAVTEVRNSGVFGANSVIGVLEGNNFMKTEKLITLSEQNLAECVKLNNSENILQWRLNAFNYSVKNGVMKETDYPSQYVTGLCKFNDLKPIVKINGFENFDRGDEYDLKRAIVLNGPTSVAIHATNALQFYASGVLDDKTCGNTIDDLNHSMLVVGYKMTSPGNDYWIVKNSWGINWGMNGYILMSMNKHNQCGIATSGIYAS